MRITDLTYKIFNFPFSTSITNSNRKFHSKEVIILKAVDESNNNHYGEVSPLIGFSKETIQDCKNEIEELIIGKMTTSDVLVIKNKLKDVSISPSVRFGIEQIILSIEFSDHSEVYTKGYSNRDVDSNDLVGVKNLSNTLNKIDDLIDRNFKTIKIKIGRDKFNDDFEILEKIHEKFGSQIKLRLDVNGKWSFEEAINNIRKISNFNIEYIEQPVKDKNELLKLTKEFGQIVVPDECVETMKDAIELIDSGLLKFIVLKPTIRLGVLDTIKIIEHANSKNVNVIITSAFETAIGRSTLLFLASITNHNFAHGLSTELLGKERINTDIDYSKSVISFDIKNFPPQINLLPK